MQPGANEEACFTPVQDFTGCGDLQRNGPTGGAAKGMPLNETTPSAETPARCPPVTSVSLISAFAWEPKTVASTAARIDSFCTEITSVIRPHNGVPPVRPVLTFDFIPEGRHVRALRCVKCCFRRRTRDIWETANPLGIDAVITDGHDSDCVSIRPFFSYSFRCNEKSLVRTRFFWNDIHLLLEFRKEPSVQ